jgi:hypothetical protein
VKKSTGHVPTVRVARKLMWEQTVLVFKGRHQDRGIHILIDTAENMELVFWYLITKKRKLLIITDCFAEDIY